MSTHDFNQSLPRQAANHVPLTPLSFLERSAQIYPDKVAVIHGQRRIAYAELYQRCRRMASALSRRGVEAGDTVAILASNIPALLEAHYGVPMCGAVLNALNSRLDAGTVAFVLQHSEAKILLVDNALAAIAEQALAQMAHPPVLIGIDDPEVGLVRQTGELEYEQFLLEGDPEYAWQMPADEWDAISLNYTSGTTGNPKGVVYHHRGAWLGAMGNSMQFRLRDDSVYLWTLPMFHCNGWTFTWAVTAAAGTHVCLREVDPKLIFRLIAEHGVTHLCGAPIVLNRLINAPLADRVAFPQVVEAATGGAAPPSKIISEMEKLGFRLTHLYGLTESFGPATVCAWQESWAELELESRAVKSARQGVRMPMMSGLAVWDEATQEPVPADGQTLGELMLQGNTVMKGYFKNPAATAAAFAGGWFHSGDLAVLHPDGYVEIKDRSKDIIISGGENISSLEVEEALYQHPAVLEAAVVAKPDETWGETPCAFITIKEGMAEPTTAEIIAFCKARMAHYKAPRAVVFQVLPKTSTGKIQKNVLREWVRSHTPCIS